MKVLPHQLRRYVIDKAAGRSPRHEWQYFDASMNAWYRADEGRARSHEHFRRSRQDGHGWCDVLGHRTSVADDLELQAFFLTIAEDEWPRLATAVRRCAVRCLREWRASGARIIASVDPASSSPSGQGALAGWPLKRGQARRSMMPR